MAEFDNIKQSVAKLAAERDRTGKPQLSNTERLSMLNGIYDGLLFLWKQCVVTGVAKGTGAIAHQLERARLEIYDLEKICDTSHGNKHVMEYEYNLPDQELN